MKLSIPTITVFTVFTALVIFSVNSLPLPLNQGLTIETPESEFSNKRDQDFGPEDSPIPNERPVCSTDRTAKLYLESKTFELCSLSTICYESELGAYCDA